MLERAPDTVRGPDVSFLSVTRLPSHRIPEQFILGAPDLAVEILFSWGQLVRDRGNRPPRILATDGVVDGEDVVPGFSLPLEDFFGIPSS